MERPVLQKSQLRETNTDQNCRFKGLLSEVAKLSLRPFSYAGVAWHILTHHMLNWNARLKTVQMHEARTRDVNTGNSNELILSEPALVYL